MRQEGTGGDREEERKIFELDATLLCQGFKFHLSQTQFPPGKCRQQGPLQGGGEAPRVCHYAPQAHWHRLEIWPNPGRF